jgi:magnesium-transporting ATPase (P-type)
MCLNGHCGTHTNSNKNIEKILKIISTASIILFGIIWISNKFNFLTQFNSIDIRNILALIYLVTSLKYYKMEVDDKDAIIQDLRTKLREN